MSTLRETDRRIAGLFQPGEHINRESVAELMDLGIQGDRRYQSMAKLQTEGIAALYNILCERPFAYLADEVGMGKTYQALGIAAIVWSLKPEANILFISPRQALQSKWKEEYDRFFDGNYRRELRDRGFRGDDCVTSALLGTPLHEAREYQRLREWVVDLAHPRPIAAFIRHTSFTRPVYLTGVTAENVSEMWQEWRDRLVGWGLHDLPRSLGRLRPEEASLAFNLEFARGLNAMLASQVGRSPAFDLVVVDEAQYLRHPENQTNQVLYEILKGNVGKWLFLSATPVHSGPRDLANLLNHYPCSEEVIPESAFEDEAELQETVRPFMVRRLRKYVIDDQGTEVAKSSYRVHESEAWAERVTRPFSTLAMGLVQKHLVRVLEGRNNRFRIGFLSSFESLQSSLRSARRPAVLDGEEGEDAGGSDWHNAQSLPKDEPEAPDSGFIDRLSTDFRRTFDLSLPHPKLDLVVREIAPRAYGTETHPGGEKFLVFTRRLSTVDELYARFERQHLREVERRIQRCWRTDLDWQTGRIADTATGLQDSRDEEPDELVDDQEFAVKEEEAKGNPFRLAMAKGGWLDRFRRTFRRTGRNALFFEESWLLRLCRAGGRPPADAARSVPPELWASSHRFALRRSGRKSTVSRARRLRFLACQLLKRDPTIFGLSCESAQPWLTALWAIFPPEYWNEHEAQGDPHEDPALFEAETLWTRWSERFSGQSLELPGEQAPADPEPPLDPEVLYRRRIVQVLIAQTLRLTDNVLDLYFADGAGAGAPDFATRFLDWLASPDPSAIRTRRVCADWIDHLDVILRTSFDSDRNRGDALAILARETSFRELNNLSPVIGVTGGSGGNRTAIRQFRTPTYPLVIVCTDTLKEGVDLHLFCDQVVHYGVAWTSGDLEQRVGRVDRFFSQIERKLREGNSGFKATLNIYYPHLVNSLERGQVAHVIARQKLAERLLDSPLRGTHEDKRSLTVDQAERAIFENPRTGEQRPVGADSWPVDAPSTDSPFASLTLPKRGLRVTNNGTDQVSASHRFYTEWLRTLGSRIGDRHIQVLTDLSLPGSIIRLRDAHGVERELTWRFEVGLGIYTLTILPAPWDDGPEFTAGRWLNQDTDGPHYEPFFRLAVPRPSKAASDPFEVIDRLVSWLEGAVPEVDETAWNVGSPWREALQSCERTGRVQWTKPHRAEARIDFGVRGNNITLYAYQGMVRLVAPIATLDRLLPSERWGRDRAPTEDAVSQWALEQTQGFSLGYLDLHNRDGLCYGVRLGHGSWTTEDRARLIRLVAQRADRYEAALVGDDVS